MTESRIHDDHALDGCPVCERRCGEIVTLRADLAALRERLAAAEKSAFDRGWAAAIKAEVAKIQMAREECETDHRQIMAWVSYLEPPADDKEKR